MSALTTTPSLSTYGVVLAALCVCIAFYLRRARQHIFPPGPKGIPLLGNVLDMPKSHDWLTYTDWAEKYGDIVSLQIFRSRLVILNSAKAANDLLEKRSSTYSDKPSMYVGGEVVGWKHSLPMTPYGQRFRDMRRLFSMLLGSKAAMSAFIPLIEKCTRRCMVDLLPMTDCDISFEPYLRKLAGALIMEIAYGYTPKNDQDDPFVLVAGRTLHEFAIMMVPGAYAVDTFPLLKYLPAWLPGGTWKTAVKAYKANFRAMSDDPFNWVKQQMKTGSYSASFCSTHLLQCESPEQEELIKMSAQGIWAGGTDTTVAQNLTFVVLMLLHPEMQARAHAELDAVIGTDRLPVLADRDLLPYVNALYLESIRFRPIGPAGGTPHYTMEDDTYNGYFIPKETLVVPNIWAMCHDPDTYENPDAFNPDRFMATEIKQSERDPRDFTFGFGRRVCPGRLPADYSSFMFCLMIIALYDILPAKGEPLPAAASDPRSHTPTMISYPPSFKCRLRPRSPHVATLLKTLSDEI